MKRYIRRTSIYSSEGYRTRQQIDQPRHQALQAGNLAFLAAYAQRWARIRCRVALNQES